MSQLATEGAPTPASKRKLRAFCAQLVQRWYSVPQFASQFASWIYKFALVSKPKRPKIQMKIPKQELKIVIIEMKGVISRILVKQISITVYFAVSTLQLCGLCISVGYSQLVNHTSNHHVLVMLMSAEPPQCQFLIVIVL